MLVKEILNQHKTSISFEFFPPKTDEASATLFETIKKLIPLKPAYVSVTYGAAGSTTRELTHTLVVRLHQETDLTIVPHLTCIGSTKADVEQILDRYNDSGIENIMALRGDPPPNKGQPYAGNTEFQHAADLVSFIKKKFPHMGIAVAGFPEGHPECPNRLKEMEYLKAKVDQGADYICTQLFFDNRDLYDFQERCEIAGIKVPIVAGIMPVTSISGLKKMAELALGARFPARLLKALSRAENNDYVKEVGVHWATEQVLDLVDNKVKGLHFYTLNRSKATIDIYKSLGITSSDGLEKHNKHF